MAEEADVRLEVEAVQAVYGGDCRVIQDFPPHLAVHIRPRTADDSSQQFVEVILGINSCDQYPSIPPHVYIVEAKGLDENRQTQLITGVKNKASELSSCLMLVALCEEAVELLSNMNHPEGNCPLCLYPLVAEDTTDSLPFMKLMSCYHCFHSKCIAQWWKWILEQKEPKTNEGTSPANLESKRDMHVGENQQKGTCPVCRKMFDEKDIVHVHEYLESELSCSGFSGTEVADDGDLLFHSASEKKRRQKIEALLKLQHDNNGLIEPRKDLAILPGMYLPDSSMAPTTSAATTSESAMLPTASTSTSSQPCRDDKHATRHAFKEKDSSSFMNKASMSKRKTTVARKDIIHHPRTQQSNRKQWIRKELSEQ
ncbi:hypothetical protein Cni_G07631 [Canna indica]|uniref:E3 ubiquitin-protein ligase RNF25 n=1 Tax=Canna indica TaxID=4628 RepID=A0AAQ3Q7R1_9LILI|nr:hypothetical protein Cni_G07631 [Canna indica]